MAFLDWLSGGQHKFIYTDSEKRQHRFSGEEFGSECVGWAQTMARLQMLKLGAFATVKPRSDLLRKIKGAPLYADAWFLSYYAGVFSAYSVVRLGVSNSEFEKVVKGMAFAGQRFASPAHPADHHSRALLVEGMGRCAALLLEAAGSAQARGDKFQFGVGALLREVLDALEGDYRGVTVDDSGADSGESAKNLNPAVEASRAIESRQLLVAILGNSASGWVNETDQSKSLLYV